MPAPLVIEGETAPAPAPAHNLADEARSSGAYQTLPSAPEEIAPVGGKGDLAAHSLGTLAADPAAPSGNAPGEEKMTRGFANNVPLTVALRQILPADYGFTLAEGVSGSALVSWKGGAPWRQTLQDMLQKAGLGMEESGQLVKIGHAGLASGGMAAAAAPVRAPAPLLQPIPAAQPVALSPGASHAPQPIAAGGNYLTPPPGAMAESAPAMASGAADMPRLASVDSWVADRGDSLHKVLEKWARRANVELSWQADYDYPLQASIAFNGTFEDSVRNLLSGFQDAKPQPAGTLHMNPSSGQAVLVVQVRGNNYND
jgi:type IV pili sensor histidine kinase/response regulator